MKYISTSFPSFLLSLAIGFSLFLASCNSPAKKEYSGEKYDFGDATTEKSTQMHIFRSDEELAEMDDLQNEEDFEPDWDQEDYYPIDEDEEMADYEKGIEEWYENKIENIEPLKHNSYVLLDTIASAYRFMKKSLDFDGRFQYYYFPDHFEVKRYKKHSDPDFEGYSITMIPSEERKPNLWSYKKGEKGAVAYNQVFNYFFKNKTTIDFYELYTSQKKIIHRIVPKIDYEDGIGFEVEFLLMAYDDIQNDENLLSAIEEIMKDHERKLANPTFMSDVSYEEVIYPSLKEVIPSQSLHRVVGDDEDMVYKTVSDLVWYYSFWLRRSQEGNMENVYSTLNAIRDDYAAM